MTQYRVRTQAEYVVREAQDAEEAATVVKQRLAERMRGADSDGVEVEATRIDVPLIGVQREDG